MADTKLPGHSPALDPVVAPAGTRQAGRLYPSPQEALKAVQEDYLYWSGKVTDYSFQLSLAVIGANWAAFKSLDEILSSIWSKWSLTLVLVNVAASVVGAKVLSELHRRQVNQGEGNPDKWNQEFEAAPRKDDPWPFTDGIVRAGKLTRELKTWLPVLAGVAFVVALLVGR